MKNQLILIAALLISIATISCSSEKFEPEVDILTADIMDSMLYNREWIKVDGNVYVNVNMNITHPALIEAGKNLESLGPEFMRAKVASTTYLVVRRDGKIVYVIGPDINKENVQAGYMDSFYVFDHRKILNMSFLYLLPKDFENDELHLVITEKNNFGYNAMRSGDGTQTITFTQPSDVWFDFTDFKRK